MAEIATFLAQFLDPFRFVFAVVATLIALAFLPPQKLAIAIGLALSALIVGLGFQFAFFPRSPDYAFITGAFATYAHCLVAWAGLAWWRR